MPAPFFLHTVKRETTPDSLLTVSIPPPYFPPHYFPFSEFYFLFFILRLPNLQSPIIYSPLSNLHPRSLKPQMPDRFFILTNLF